MRCARPSPSRGRRVDTGALQDWWDALADGLGAGSLLGLGQGGDRGLGVIVGDDGLALFGDFTPDPAVFPGLDTTVAHTPQLFEAGPQQLRSLQPAHPRKEAETAGQQAEQRRLAGTGRTNDRHRLPCRDGKGILVQNG